MNENIQKLFKLAKYAGGRFDLVQAAGGNVSFKNNEGSLFIKISGISLSEMDSEQHYARLNNQLIVDILNDRHLLQLTSQKARENYAKSLLAAANMTPEKRPSIETFLHALLFSYTLHTHPIAVNHLVIRKDAEKWINDLFPEALFIKYVTPGIELALSLQEGIHFYKKKHLKFPQIIFLGNHGLLVSTDHSEEIIYLMDNLLEKIEMFLGINYKRYQIGSRIARLFEPVFKPQIPIAWLSEDAVISSLCEDHPTLMNIHPTSPDFFVFNGLRVCHLQQLHFDEIQNFFNQYGMYPKVIYYQNKLFFIHSSVRKAKEMEEVFKFHLMALQHADNIQILSQDEIHYLATWEAEHYRQKV